MRSQCLHLTIFLLFVMTSISSAVSAGEAGASHVLKKNQPIQTQNADGTALTLSWLELNDSRCPKGVQCIVAGQAQLRLAAEVTGRDRGEIVLVIGATRRPGDGNGTATIGPFHIELLSVDPYPEAGVTPTDEDRQATVLIEPRSAGSR